MAKVKLNIEISDEAYESLKKKVKELAEKMPGLPIAMSVEQYIEQMVESLAILEKGMGANFKEMMKNASTLFGDMPMDMGEIFKGQTKTSNKEEKKDEKKTLDELLEDPNID